MTRRWLQSADVDISDSGALTVGTGKTYKRARINASAAGDNVIVAAVPGKAICVVAINVTAKLAVDVTICSGTGNAKPLSAVKSLGDTGGWVDAGSADPAAYRYGTDAGESLNIYTSAASKGVGVEIVYYEE